MKKYILSFAIIIIALSLSAFLLINISVYKNINRDKKVLNFINNIFQEKKCYFSNDYGTSLTKLEIDSTNYIGVINIVNDNLLLPVESECNNNFIKIQSACYYYSDPLIIFGTNLKDSFYSFMSYQAHDIVLFTNMLGETFSYKITEIKRVSKLDNILEHKKDLLIVIKNYYDMEYVLLICNFY